MNRKRWIFLVCFGFLFLAALMMIIKFKKKEIKIDHIYLITIDTLRADHLGCFGYPRNTTPFIDSLAEKGIVFTKTYSQSATTAPSHASIFTGLYPYQHKVLANGLVLEDSYTTLAEILSQNGFFTAGFASTVVHFNEPKLNQGFEFYNDPGTSPNKIGGGYRSARLTKKNAVHWLSNFNPNRKLFMWLHFFDPHVPYRPPKENIEKIEKCLKKDDFIKYLKKIQIDAGVFNHSTEMMYQEITKYDAEIRYVDEELKHFFEFVTDNKSNNNALWIITSDHGEGLGQHRWYSHGKLLYQEAIHVPLIFYFTHQRIKPGKIDDVVENFDIFPTVLEALNIKINKKLKKEVKAVSLWKKIVRKISFVNRKYAFSQRRIYYDKKQMQADDGRLGSKYCIQYKKFKYIYNTEFPDEFFNLNADAFELDNKSNDKNWQKMKNRFKKMMFKILDDAKKYKDKKVRKIGKKGLEELKTLGYIL